MAAAYAVLKMAVADEQADDRIVPVQSWTSTLQQRNTSRQR